MTTREAGDGPPRGEQDPVGEGLVRIDPRKNRVTERISLGDYGLARATPDHPSADTLDNEGGGGLAQLPPRPL
jgi:hypothetical protein